MSLSHFDEPELNIIQQLPSGASVSTAKSQKQRGKTKPKPPTKLPARAEADKGNQHREKKLKTRTKTPAEADKASQIHEATVAFSHDESRPHETPTISISESLHQDTRSERFYSSIPDNRNRNLLKKLNPFRKAAKKVVDANFFVSENKRIRDWKSLSFKIIIALVVLLSVAGGIAGIAVFGFGESPHLQLDGTVSLDDRSYWATLKKDCGRPKIKPELIASRIVGGTEAKANSWPWQISLSRIRNAGFIVQYRHICGGTIVSPNFVITAVHCFLNSDNTAFITDYSSLRIIVGAHYKSSVYGGARTSEIEKVIHHPANNLEIYTKRRLLPQSDISLVKLKRSFDPSAISPIVTFACLPEPGRIPRIGMRCWSTGWGKTLGSGYDKVLKQAPLPVISARICNLYYGKKINYRYHLCIHEKNLGTCSGDSGGPTVCLNRYDRYVLYGVTSFGSRACTSSPGVLASVAHYVRWICCTINDPDLGPCSQFICG